MTTQSIDQITANLVKSIEDFGISLDDSLDGKEGRLNTLFGIVSGLSDQKLDKTATAVAANKLATPRAINGVAFDGTKDITIAAVDQTARDAAAAATSNANTRLLATASAVSANKLSTPRAINGVPFDGANDITISAVDQTARDAAAAATANANTRLLATATAAAATRLSTARNINGIAFDGTNDITISAIDQAARDAAAAATSNANTRLLATATAAAATKLASPRAINGVDFDGTKNIAIADQTARDSAAGAQSTADRAISVSSSYQSAIDNAVSVANSAAATANSLRDGGTGLALSVNGTMVAGQNGASFEVRNAGGAGDGGMAAIKFHCTSAYGIMMGLRADGYFGIGGWSRGAWSWYTDPSGNMYAAGNITGYSDIRLKKDIVNIPCPLKKIRKLNGVTFTRRDTGARQTGLIAQEVQAVLPEAVEVGCDDDKTLSVAYGNIVGLLVEGIKAIEDRIDEIDASTKKILNLNCTSRRH